MYQACLAWARRWCARRLACGMPAAERGEVLPVALDSVSTASIHRHYCHRMRILKGYSKNLSYGTTGFVEKFYEGQLVDHKTQW